MDVYIHGWDRLHRTLALSGSYLSWSWGNPRCIYLFEISLEFVLGL